MRRLSDRGRLDERTVGARSIRTAPDVTGGRDGLVPDGDPHPAETL